MVISRNLLIKGNKRAYTIPVYGEQMQTADYVYDELDIYSHKIANEVIFYDKHTLSKPKHHTTKRKLAIQYHYAPHAPRRR